MDKNSEKFGFYIVYDDNDKRPDLNMNHGITHTNQFQIPIIQNFSNLI